MPDFSRRSNYSENESFDSVRFGANAGVLEVEMNEVQDITRTKVKRIHDAIGAGVYASSNGSISFNESTKVLTLTNCVAISGGLSVTIPSKQVTLSATNKCAYVKLEFADNITYGDTLKAYGDTGGANVSNTIKDSRSSEETSRRGIVKFTLTAAASVPANTDSVTYAPIGTLETDGKFYPDHEDADDTGLVVRDGQVCQTYNVN